MKRGYANPPLLKKICKVLGVEEEYFVSKELTLGDKKTIPYYDIDVSASKAVMFDDKKEIPSFQVLIPGFEDCNFAVPLYGHSMYPTFENGSIILCKQINDLSLLQLGECYLIITNEFRMVKRIISNCATKDCIRAVSDNEEMRKDGSRKYEPIEIPKNLIRGLYIIKGCVKRYQT